VRDGWLAMMVLLFIGKINNLNGGCKLYYIYLVFWGMNLNSFTIIIAILGSRFIAVYYY
jgi:hypothetical protein